MAGYKTRRKTSATTDERKITAAALKDRLTQWQADADPALIAMALATHDGYSDRNACLIAMQDPEATDVSGFKTWIGRGRCVRNGEHGIQILAPAGTGRKDQAEHADYGAKPGESDVTADSKPRQFFKITHVFDVRQTDPLPAEGYGDEHQAGEIRVMDRSERHVAEMTANALDDLAASVVDGGDLAGAEGLAESA